MRIRGRIEALIIADSETTFADAVTRLLQNPTQRRALGKQAQQVVRKHYDWSALIPCLLGIYQEIGLG